MFVSKIVPCKNKDRVNIYSEEGYKCSLNMEFILKYRILEGKDIADDILNEAIVEDSKRYAFDLAIKYISGAPHTKKQVEDYLLKKGISKSGINSAIHKLKEYKYINDDDYAQSFIEELIRKGFSRRAAFRKLTEHGIDKDTANEKIEFFTDDIEKENAAKAYEAIKRRYGDLFDKKTRDKIWRAMTAKGFDAGAVSKLLSGAQDEFWDD